ncbi:hypothetical protein CMO88_02910 [Candidatus Woesearchaeota archaeon]|nr:hypothetical protein [Candidatus Woesearchaeota archaeon]|tara:strand:+ start:7648 stop:7884 length:237 start_codon:yes stop_codon:yes gene_type:complete
MNKGIADSLVDVEFARLKIFIRILPFLATVIAIVSISVYVLDDKFKDYAIFILAGSFAVGAVVNVVVDKKVKKIFKSC